MKMNVKPKSKKNNIFDEGGYHKKVSPLVALLISLATLAVFILIMFGLYRFQIVEIPLFVRDFLNKNEVNGHEYKYNEKTYDDENFLNFIQKGDDDSENSSAYIDIRTQDLTWLVSSAPFIKEYSLTQNVNYYDSERRQIIYKNKIWVKGDKYLVEVYNESGTMTKYILCDGKQVHIKDYTVYDEPHVKTYPISDEFTLENQVGLIDIRTLFDNEDIYDMIIDFTRDERSNLYTITYAYADIPELTHKVILSFDYGIINGAETFYNGEMIHRTNIEGKVNTENISDNIFILK
jgi:hypothetical protein